jgi:hypothetical protein
LCLLRFKAQVVEPDGINAEDAACFSCGAVLTGDNFAESG